jgi:hypothetical protein
MSTAAQKRKSAIDALVAKDRVAVFWFMAACLVGGACAWYLVVMAEALKARPPFVVMDSSGAFYVEPGVNFPQAEPMHFALTEIAVETLFDRGPEGLVNEKRLPKICDRDGLNKLKETVRKEDPYFIGQQVRQTVEIDQIKVLKTLPTAVATGANGMITRNLVFNGQPLTERYKFTVIFTWKLNPDVRGTGAFPAVIHDMAKYDLERISEP